MRQIWEYKNIRTEHLLSKVRERATGPAPYSNDKHSVNVLLNRMGKDGWELVGMHTHFTDTSTHPDKPFNRYATAYQTEFVFKRPKED